MKLLAISLLAVALAGCSLSPKPDMTVAPPDRLRLDRPDSVAMKACTWPLAIKLATLTQKQAEDLIGTNADNQIDCIERHRILVDFITTRDSGLTASAAK